MGSGKASSDKGVVEYWSAGVMRYTDNRNINRGYMKLDVWQKGIELYKLIWEIVRDGKSISSFDHKFLMLLNRSHQILLKDIAADL